MKTILVPSREPWPSSDPLFDLSGDFEADASTDGVCFYGNDPTSSARFAETIGSRVRRGLRTSVVGGVCDHRLVGNLVVLDEKKLTSVIAVVVASQHSKAELSIGTISCLVRNGFRVKILVVDDGHWDEMRGDYILCLGSSFTFDVVSRSFVRSVVSQIGSILKID